MPIRSRLSGYSSSAPGFPGRRRSSRPRQSAHLCRRQSPYTPCSVAPCNSDFSCAPNGKPLICQGGVLQTVCICDVRRICCEDVARLSLATDCWPFRWRAIRARRTLSAQIGRLYVVAHCVVGGGARTAGRGPSRRRRSSSSRALVLGRRATRVGVAPPPGTAQSRRRARCSMPAASPTSWSRGVGRLRGSRGRRRRRGKGRPLHLLPGGPALGCPARRCCQRDAGDQGGAGPGDKQLMVSGHIEPLHGE